MTEKTKILIVGNGFGGIYTLKNLGKLFPNKKRVEFAMIGENNYFLFTPLLHEVATGGISPLNILEPIRKVLGCCLDNFYLGKVENINLKDKNVQIKGKFISYDYLILAPGAETNFYNIPGAEQNSFTLKSIMDAIKIKNHCIAQIEQASHTEDNTERQKMLNFVVVGGGPTGVELVTELEEFIRGTFSLYYPKKIIEDVSVTLIQKGPELVPQFNKKIRQKSLGVLKRKGIEVMLQSEVKEVTDSYILVNDNIKIETETVIWVAGIKPVKLEFSDPISVSTDGRLIVNEYLQLENYENVFAVGDIASFKQENTNAILPALAQVAEKESRKVAKNIKLILSNKKLEKFTYKSSGSLISLGQWMAMGEVFNFVFSGRIAWWIWRTVYLFKLISWRKKVRVAVDWTMNLFSARDISQIQIDAD